MGIDVPNIRTILHWGPPNDIECYVQETGRGGRDGKGTSAYLYYNRRDISQSGHLEESMHAYCLNSTHCRRQLLMAPFNERKIVASPVPMHLCCYVCAKLCVCNSCTVDEDFNNMSKEDVENFDQTFWDEPNECQLKCTLSAEHAYYGR